MPPCGPQHFASGCPSRLLFDQIADKWSMMVLTVLEDGPLRFNAVKRRPEGVTQRALTQCPRRLESNGLVSGRVIPVSPVAVEYTSSLGRTLQEPLKALYAWTRVKIDARGGAGAAGVQHAHGCLSRARCCSKLVPSKEPVAAGLPGPSRDRACRTKTIA